MTDTRTEFYAGRLRERKAEALHALYRIFDARDCTRAERAAAFREVAKTAQETADFLQRWTEDEAI